VNGVRLQAPIQDFFFFIIFYHSRLNHYLFQKVNSIDNNKFNNHLINMLTLHFTCGMTTIFN